MWGAMIDYSRAFSDSKHAEMTAKALSLASYGTIGSFLGPSSILSATLLGKWNGNLNLSFDNR
jgi:hypothetical protein